MIIGFRNLRSLNDGTVKSVSVSALEDGNGGEEEFAFVIINQTKTVKMTFAANQEQTVPVTHTASGKGVVTVSATGSQQSSTKILDVDKQPGDDGTGG